MPIEQVRSELQSRGIDTTAATARVLAAVHAATQSQPQATNIDDPSGDGWRWVRRGEALSDGDVEKINGGWRPTIEAGYTCPRNHCYRRRIEPQQPQATEPDDPSGPGWRWVEVGEWVEPTDMWEYLPGKWRGNASLGALCVTANYYRRRIEQPQPSDSETETIEDLRRQLAACEMLLAEAGGSGEQVNAELQQLRADLAEVTRERDQYLDSYQRIFGDLETIRETTKAAAVEAISEWLEPVRLVDHPNLSNETLQHLPQIMRHLTGLDSHAID
jgi:hypothetical protein